MEKRILVAALNWGLGHATRCIPIINALIEEGFVPIIASDGSALKLLQKEFPSLDTVTLPSYNISYTKSALFFKLKLILDLPKLLKSIKAEKKAVSDIVKQYHISGILSDNRPGVRNKKIPSVYITHQLHVLSGITTWFSTTMHQNAIKKFNMCWVPDVKGKGNLSGKLGHTNTFKTPVKYIGPLSRFKKKNIPVKNDFLVLLSGPEPQRTLLEEKILDTLKTYSGNIVMVKGIVEDKQTVNKTNNWTLYNFMTASQLEQIINESNCVVSRSGYTTIMDLAQLNKNAFFIPTPGQYEQEYLARRLTEMGVAPSCKQNEFTLEKLEEVKNFSGLKPFVFETQYKALFNLF